MYGKIFQSLYSGSMVGSGAIVFAVWGYVIANARPERLEKGSKVVTGGTVELNPVLLAAILGEPREAVEKAIEFLCEPDPKTTTQRQEGRRLIRLGTFEYRVVNYVKYRQIRDEEMRRKQNREAQARFRANRRNGVKKAPRKAKAAPETDVVPEMSLEKKVEFHGFLDDPTTHPNVNF